MKNKVILVFTASVLIFSMISAFTLVYGQGEGPPKDNNPAEKRRDISGEIQGNLDENAKVPENGRARITGDIGESANISGAGSIVVEGTVRGRVNIGGSVRVKGNLNYGASIETDENVGIDGNVAGNIRADGRIDIKGEVSGSVTAGSDVNVGKNILAGAEVTLESPGTSLKVSGGIDGGAIRVSARNVDVEVDENLQSGSIDSNSERARVSIGGSVGPDASIEGNIDLEIENDVSGQIRIRRNVRISRSVRAGARVRSGENIYIGENLERDAFAGLENAGGGLQIRNTVRGRVRITENARISAGQIPVEDPVDVSVDNSPLNGVNISVRNRVSGVEINISNLGREADEAENRVGEKVYNYQRIDLENLPASEIENARLRFRVRNIWMEGENVEAENLTVRRRHDGAWENLDTRIVGENSTHVTVEASSPGFSTFAVMGAVVTEESEESPESGIGIPWMFVGVAIAVLIGIFSVFLMRR